MDEQQNKQLGEYIIELARGNMAALEQIYTIMVRYLYAIGNVYFDRREDIEDAIHDLLFVLIDKAAKFKANKNACAFVTILFRNYIKDKFRKQKRERALAQRLEPVFEAEGDEKYIENHIFIRQVFENLTRYEQDLMIYYCWGKLSYAEIAKLYHKPKSTIESQIERIKKKI